MIKKKKPKHSAADAFFREVIWARDQGRDRLTGKPLERDSEDFDKRGDVCHIKPKGAYPELRHETWNAVLLSRRNHIASDARGWYLLKIEGNADTELIFRKYDHDGDLLWEKVSPCPSCPSASNL